jgi:6,7-dimethyl-8-ribityllumazine synthase
MPKILEGKLSAEGKKFGIVVSRFNDFISDRLLSGALDALTRFGVRDEDIVVAKVPGAFEIPVAARKMVDMKKYDAVLCLGAVIRGATPHFEFVASESAKGVAQVALSAAVPVIYGVLTADTIEQAIERAGTKAGNKGWSAAVAAVEMVNLLAQMSSRG